MTPMLFHKVGSSSLTLTPKPQVLLEEGLKGDPLFVDPGVDLQDIPAVSASFCQHQRTSVEIPIKN